MDWPKAPKYWIENETLMVSIPFTWDLPGVLLRLKQRNFWWDCVVVGGPAVELLPGFFDGLDYVTEGHDCPGVLQRINPMATRTTLGCVRRCKFCAIGSGRIEGEYRELDDWPNLPVLCDNNLLAASKSHFDRVMDGLLAVHGWCDFNQGIDSRLLTDHHANRMAELPGGETRIRLALDHMDCRDQWAAAFDRLCEAGVAKRRIKSYCLIGFDTGPKECWQRCEWVEGHGIQVFPMWFHGLAQMERNMVTEDQKRLGWTDRLRVEIMTYYYKHRGSVPCFAAAI